MSLASLQGVSGLKSIFMSSPPVGKAIYRYVRRRARSHDIASKADASTALYFMFIVQIIANASFEIWAVIKIVQGFRKTRLRGSEWRFDISIVYAILHTVRLLLSSVLSTFSMLVGAYVLKVYPNFNVVALLPVSPVLLPVTRTILTSGLDRLILLR